MSEHGTAALSELERECADGRTAPRVSLADIEANMDVISFAAGDQIVALDSSAWGQASVEAVSSLRVLTVCIIQLKNGFSIIGKSAPADPANYDHALGRKLAYDDAVRQIWPLMGYALREDMRFARHRPADA